LAFLVFILQFFGSEKSGMKKKKAVLPHGDFLCHWLDGFCVRIT